MAASASKAKLASALAAGVAGAAALALLYRWSRQRLRVAKIVVYPIKGCKGIPVRSARVQPEGLEHDREFIVVCPAEDGSTGWRFLTQRELPALALVEPSMPTSTGGGKFTVKAPGMRELSVPFPDAGAKRIALDIFGNAAEGLDCGDSAAAWFAKFLQAPGARLLRHVGVRRIDETFAKGVSRFSDGYPLLVLTEASLASVERATGLGLALQRFRPNLVLAGAGPYSEDAAKGVTGGSGAAAVKLRFVKPCSRCQVPSVDPVLGTRGKDPLRDMKASRSGQVLKDQQTAMPGHYQQNLGAVFFGQNAVPEFSAGSEGVLAVGDAAEWM
uniref:MOSC domain-containing protein n=1 Tax=Alexandrium monilatum TaxID=311494 RepID=A0A7S4S1I5_9DINO